MKNKLNIAAIILSFLGFPILYYMALDTGVSLKYETELNECISSASGINLCKQLDLYLGLSYLSGIVFLSLIIILIIKKFKRKRLP